MRGDRDQSVAAAARRNPRDLAISPRALGVFAANVVGYDQTRADYRSLSDGVNWKSDYTGDKVQRLSEEMSRRIVRIPNQSTTQIKTNL